MSAKPTDYLVASAVSIMRGADNSALETIEDIGEAIEQVYPVNLSGDRLLYLAKHMERYGFIDITSDEYAGDYITPLSGWGVTNRLNKIKDANPQHGLYYALERGERLLNLAFQNPQYWEDLDAEIAAQPEAEPLDDNLAGDQIPIADGYVSLTHNQFKEIDEPTGSLLDELERDNGIPDHPGLKERLMGQVSAGRELLRAGEFQLGIFRSTMLDGLAEIKERYGDHAIGAAASALMTLILHLLEIPGF